MNTVDEDDDCRGAGGMTVIVTGADGTEWIMVGNSAGNFWLDADVSVALPYTARIEDAAGNVRQKLTPVNDGDCASCHTRNGANGASGRLIPPLAL